jgi:hypothetical protein
MTAMTTPHHQVASATAHLRAIADGVVDASVWSMTAPETATTLVELTRLQAQVVELRSRVAAHADELQVGSEVGATSTANWLAHSTKLTRPAAARVVRLGYDLSTHDHVRTALAAGDLRPEQHLVAAAQEHDAKTLRILGRRLLEVIAPDLADQHEADLLEQEEAKAAQSCRLTMTDDGRGRTYGRFTLPGVAGRGAEEDAPGPSRAGADGERVLRAHRTVPAKALPKVGGRDATIVVTIDLDTLTDRLEKAGVLDTGERICRVPLAGSRAPPGSSPSSSTATARSSTSASRTASSPRLSSPP